MGGNLWCQERDCSSANLPLVFDYGEQIGDMHIIKMAAVLHTAAIYEAERGDEKIFLKVAHEGYHARLIREAHFLRHLTQQGISHPSIPTLLPAHRTASLESFPFGTTVFGEQTLYYLVLEHQDGNILRNALLKNRQPWYQDVGWMMMGIFDGLALMHQQNVLHLCLCPESILVRMDQEHVPRPLLLDLGAVTSVDNLSSEWQPNYMPAGYTAPELLHANGEIGPKTDTYGAGLIFYELLAGQPAYEYRLRWDKDIYAAIQAGGIAPLIRPDLDDGLVVLINRAVEHIPNQRPDIAKMGTELMAIYPPLPPEKEPWRFNWNLFWIVTGILFVVSLLLVTAYVLAEPLAT